MGPGRSTARGYVRIGIWKKCKKKIMRSSKYIQVCCISRIFLSPGQTIEDSAPWPQKRLSPGQTIEDSAPWPQNRLSPGQTNEVCAPWPQKRLSATFFPGEVSQQVTST